MLKKCDGQTKRYAQLINTVLIEFIGCLNVSAVWAAIGLQRQYPLI